MSSLLTTAELALQDRARGFVDELIPWEVEAEMNRGDIPGEVLVGHKEKARELALTSINMSERLGGPGYSMLAQVLIQEQTGRVTNALGWVVSTGPSWIEEVATDFQIEKWIRPTVDGDIHECYAITEERAGSDVDGIEATARSDGDDYVLNGSSGTSPRPISPPKCSSSPSWPMAPTPGVMSSSSSTWTRRVSSASGFRSTPIPTAITTGR